MCQHHYPEFHIFRKREFTIRTGERQFFVGSVDLQVAETSNLFSMFRLINSSSTLQQTETVLRLVCSPWEVFLRKGLFRLSSAVERDPRDVD